VSAVDVSGTGGRPASAAELRQAIDAAPMSRLQVRAIVLCVVLNMLDGFDVLVMAFTASEVGREWSLSGTTLGVLLSAGLFGMAGGSLFVAPWGDRIGRRAVILLCLAVMTAGMFASALAQGPGQLTILRAITGVGVGGILASLNVITSEYSSRRWRGTAVGLQVTGYPIGATVGGTIAAFLISRYGWRSAFLFGAVASGIVIPVVMRSLPESLDFLLTGRVPDALKRLNDLLRRMGRPTVAELPVVAKDEHAARNPVGRLFAGATARSTVLIWCAFFLLMFGFYFVTSWTPRLLVSAGRSTGQGITGGVLLNVGGIVGGSLFSFLAAKAGLRPLAAVYLVLTSVSIVLFGLFASDLALAFVIALVIGVCLFGSMVGLYAMTPALYPAAIRTTGMGWAIGIGRIGAILAPIVAGLLIDAGWSASQLYYAFAVPVAATVLAVRSLRV
jgi:benzoate transport